MALKNAHRTLSKKHVPYLFEKYPVGKQKKLTRK